MNRIFKKIKNLLYSIPFGMKGAEDEVFGTDGSGAQGVTISQEVSDKRVANHLLKGEVTQEVEELRYRTYLVADESENYSYVGNGIALKDGDRVKKPFNGKIKFVQENSLLCASILDEFKHMNDYGTEKYRIETTYNYLSRFKIEKYITKVKVEIDEGEKKIMTTLSFSKYPNKYDATSKPFVSELSSICNGKPISRSELSDAIKVLSFTTYKAYGEEDLVSYSFIDPSFISCSESDGTYDLIYEWKEYMRLPLNLETKYFSKEMDDKYRTMARKDTNVNVANVERKVFCSVCGKEMSTYDADILRYDGKQIICNECLKKAKNED